jgi:CrcB protein
MKNYAFLALGGVAGVVLRYQIGQWMSAGSSTTSFPWPTFTINVLGSFALGFLMKYLLGVASAPHIRLMFTTGFCGGFTTLSTFSYEFVTLLTERQFGVALAYAGLTMTIAPAACLAGFAVAALAL